MKITNLTPHPLRIHGRAGEIRDLAVDGPAPRLTPQRTPLGDLDGLPLGRTVLGDPTGLPDPEDGVVLIVSALVAEACPDRTDLVYPGEAVRDERGRITGAKGLCAGPGMARERGLS